MGNDSVDLSAPRVQAIADRLTANKPVRRTLPGGGRLHIDRQLPFLCVWRKPETAWVDDGTRSLIVAEASYLLAASDRNTRRAFANLVRTIVAIMAERYGGFLIVEVWSGNGNLLKKEVVPQKPRFQLYYAQVDELLPTLGQFRESLSRVKISKLRAGVELVASGRTHPPGMTPLLSRKDRETHACYCVGVEVDPIYFNARTNEVFPLVMRSFKKQLGRALDEFFYNFSVKHTTHQPSHYYALGRRAMVKAVWDADRRLAAVSNTFDVLLQITPANVAEAWKSFERRGCEKKPVFLYRPLPIDPGGMKRSLYNIHIDRIEDPTLQHLFLDKQMELDRQLTMLQDVGKPAFMYGGLQLYGEVGDSLLRSAKRILRQTSSNATGESAVTYIGAAAFSKRVAAEMAWYAERFPGFKSGVQVRDDLFAGILTSRGRLLLGKDLRVPASRVDALIQHEVGTHLLTYFNGQAQPFKMLYTGLPGYDELQEGIAVLAEYLAGGLSIARLRTLAARVLAVHAMTQGALFVEVFRMLHEEHGFAQRPAFTMAMRVFRGGGFVKDAIYLRGLVGVLDYLSDGGALEKLFVGKLAAAHIPMIDELLHRKILIAPPLTPRYLQRKRSLVRLSKIRKGARVLDLLST